MFDKDVQKLFKFAKRKKKKKKKSCTFFSFTWNISTFP